MPPLAANDADTQAFDHQFLIFQVHFDRGKLGVFSQQPDFARFIDGLADPVIILAGTSVRLANKAAMALLGDPRIQAASSRPRSA